MSEMDAPPKMEQFWEDPLMNHGGHGHNNSNSNSSGISSGSSDSGNTNSGGHNQQQYERNLNFATGAVEENEYGFPKKKTIRDPLSHRIIEKRRRDRMNNCLADLARLLPPSSLRKGRGRIEKTEIVELAIKHLRHLQCHPCTSGDKCEFNYIAKSSSKNNSNPSLQNHSLGRVSSPTTSSTIQSTPESHFRLGFQECMSEAMHFLVEEEGRYPGDGLCIRILKHLTTHSENVLRDNFGEDGKLHPKEENKGKFIKESESISGSGESGLSGYQHLEASGDGNGVQDGESFAHPGLNTVQLSGTERQGPTSFDFEGDNSCESTQLSLDISDVFSTSENKNSVLSGNKPPLPTIICSTNSIQTSHAKHSSSNGRSSDEGQDGHDAGSLSPSNSVHQYKFKSTIKQRFTADLEKPEDQGCSRKDHSSFKNSLDHKKSSHTDSQGNFSNEEYTASMKLENKLTVELEDDCESMKSFRSRRGSSTMGKSGRMIPYEREITTLDSRGATIKASSTKFGRPLTVAPYTCTGIQDADIKLSPQELLKAISKAETPTLPLPLLFDENTSDRKSVGVPAFALHDKGLYYIPLTIDKSVLSPYLAKLEPHTPPPLHPVTISVCFLLAPPGKITEEGAACKVVEAVHLPLNPAELLKAIPIPNPIVTRSAVTPVVVKPHRSSRESAANFVINRFSQSQSQSRQYGNGTEYRYPISAASAYGNTIALPGPGLGSTGITTTSQSSGPKEYRNSHQYNPNYYSSSEGGNVSNSGMFSLPPLHVPGYGSSSSSSSSSSSNPSRCSRKRSICSSPMSAASSIGYHSLHEKYSPSSTQDFYRYSSNTHSNVSQPHNQTSQSHGNHSIPHVPLNHNYINSNHLVPMYNDKTGGRSTKEGTRRSGSPTKMAKKTRDTVDESYKSKPSPIGQTIHLPSHSSHQ